MRMAQPSSCKTTRTTPQHRPEYHTRPNMWKNSQTCGWEQEPKQQLVKTQPTAASGWSPRTVD